MGPNVGNAWSEVYAGDTVLIVSANTGFSIGDIIRITRDGQPRFTEYVAKRRLASGSALLVWDFVLAVLDRD